MSTATATARVKPKLRGVSHQLAFFTALLAGGLVVSQAARPIDRLAGSIHTVCLAAMFGVSALYHRPTWTPAARQRMRRLDHAAIFLLIAGTYTPFCLLGVGGDAAGRLLVAVWATALVGMIKAVFWPHSPKWITALTYIAVGWVGLFFVDEIFGSVGIAGTILMWSGAAFYSLGALVYALRRPDPVPAVFGYHEIFHALVIVASVCFFSAIGTVMQFR